MTIRCVRDIIGGRTRGEAERALTCQDARHPTRKEMSFFEALQALQVLQVAPFQSFESASARRTRQLSL